MHFVQTLHVLFVGIWLGCVGVEFILENAPRFYPELKRIVPALHYKIDQYVELPTVMGVLVSGFWVVRMQPFSKWLAIKVIAGLIAVLANLLCWIPVSRRKQAAERGDKEGVRRHSIALLRLTQLGLPAALLALLIALLSALSAAS